MATFIDNQAVKIGSDFNNTESCGCHGQNFCQLVQQNDITAFQFLTNTVGSDLVTNGGFASESNWSFLGAELVDDGTMDGACGADWTCGTGWSMGGGVATHTPAGLGADFEQPLSLSVGKKYRLYFDVLNYASGNLNTVFASAGNTTQSADGTYTFDRTSSGLLDLIRFRADTVNDFDGDIDNVSIKELGWTISGGKATHNLLSVLPLTQTGVFVNKLYKITFTVSGRTDGSLSLSAGNTITYLDSLVLISNKTYTLYVDLTGGILGSDLSFIPTSDFDGSIDNVSVYEMQTDWEIVIKDKNSVPVLNPTDVIDYSDSQNVTVTIDWSQLGLDDGCYKICLGNLTSIEVPNYTFSADTDWDKGIGWTISGGKANSTVNANGSLLTHQTVNLNWGESYRVTYTVSNVTGTWQVRAVLGTNPGEYHGTGTFTDIIQCDGGTTLNFQSADTHASPISGSIDNVIVELITADDCSDCIALKETHNCSLLLKWRNDEDMSGIDYENFPNFYQYLRINGVIGKPKHSKEKDIFKLSNGERILLTSNSRKIYKLDIADAPEYIHDAISSGIDHDDFYIDGTEYLAEASDYEPSWRKSSLTAPVTIEIELPTQDNENPNCA